MVNGVRVFQIPGYYNDNVLGEGSVNSPLQFQPINDIVNKILGVRGVVSSERYI